MARKRHVGWRPTGAAVTFALAAAAGVVGNQLTGHLSIALAAFVVLLVAGMMITFLLERAASGSASSDDHGAEDANRQASTQNLQGARGVQIGDGNRQTNFFGDQPGPDRRR